MNPQNIKIKRENFDNYFEKFDNYFERLHKRYITQYEGGIYLEREDEKISVVVGLQI